MGSIIYLYNNHSFGMQMPGRSLTLNSYRFSFNTQEKVDEISGTGNHNTAKFWEYDTRLGRRWNLDPKPVGGFSDYACLSDNPIWNIDVLGDKPTPKEAAAMTSHVYGDKSDKILRGRWKVSDQNFNIQKKTESGLKSQVYERTKRGKTEYTYATTGTEDYTDAIQDGKQPFGLSEQFKQSMSNAVNISEQLGKGIELTFTGHSLGGAEATANAYATGRDAITFNAAGVSSKTIKENRLSRIDAYIMITDPLNIAQSIGIGLPAVNGTVHYVPFTDQASISNGHSMDNMLKVFDINPELYRLQYDAIHRKSGLDNFNPQPIITPNFSK